MIRKYFITAYFLLFYSFNCAAMQSDNKKCLHTFLMTAPQPIIGRIRDYLNPDEFEVGVITAYFEEHKDKKLSEIPEYIYDTFGNLEYYHKILMTWLIISQTTGNNIKDTLKKLAKQTTRINIYVAGHEHYDNLFQLLPDLRECASFANSDSLYGHLKMYNHLGLYPHDAYLLDLKKALKEKYNIGLLRSKKYTEIPQEDNKYWTFTKVYHSFVFPIPFSLILDNKDELLNNLSNRIDTIFKDEQMQKSLTKNCLCAMV
ncbi:MAG: hypothetical protein WA432_00580 [Candidatus Babeliaceae bacterium]